MADMAELTKARFEVLDERFRPVGGDDLLVRLHIPNDRVLRFELDEQRLYVVDSRVKHIRVFDFGLDGALSGGSVFATCAAGTFDGIRLDEHGRVWAEAHDGLHCVDLDGTLLGKLLVPEIVSNLAFGGPKRNDVFIAATTSVYTLRVNFRGATYPPARGR